MSQATPPPPPSPGPVDYPVKLDLASPPEIKRWLPLVAWLLAFPHYFVYLGLIIVAGVLQFISIFTILFTKKMPESFKRIIIMALRYGWRINAYTTFLVNEYPPFAFEGGETDPGTYPPSLSIQTQAEYHRFLPLVKWLLAIPQFIVLYFLQFAAAIVTFIAVFAVLFTKKWPEGMRDFVIGVYRWSNRVNGYVMLLTDKYPPFSLDT